MVAVEIVLYTYPQLYSGILVKRYKRFFADIELATGELITAHCPNTGPMTGVCQIGAPVQVSFHDNPKRKLAYTWETIEIDRVWVGINTALPNKLVKIALEQHLFPELETYQTIRSEVVYGQDGGSRIDFLLSGGARSIYVEVKNTTWSSGDVAIFPDTETTRGQKHLRELIEVMPEYRAVMLYFINRGDKTKFAPGDTTDPVYGRLLRTAVAKGLEVLPCRFNVTPEGVEYLGLAELVL
ncbi:DNA/RNA nuclease SfsA [Chamaesiphon polymorphus CCALA 037]|uniref:Sugar fermentation stimulation protein homolog n=1 Tax=Chamaesiphon polymorphus CCALA 037 TaxID=2107692 RepID=A0A2T1FV17_9CYAN|nr:DNA/RNA nuclease SfsA [Chamaesiphon polymorphus]PSB48834.1 DNA/RNA nuclease SfsA [Chamaesiphon polymorphus CCALA 037]